MRKLAGAAAIVAMFVLAARAQAPVHPTIDRAAMAARVKAEFLHAWDGYKKYAWGHDELMPLSKGPRDWQPGSTLLMTPVDALDTMILMGLTGEADATRAYIVHNLDVTQDASVQVFEITIRLLGGLLSEYELSNDPALLRLATTLGDRLMPAFRSPTGMPYRFVNLRTGAVRDPDSNPAEIGTLILEFGTLSKLTHNPSYLAAAKRALQAVYERRSSIGLVGEGLNVETGKWTSTDSHVGGAIDSYYEYLLKCDRLLGDADCRAMWTSSIGAINRYVADEVDGALWYGTVNMNTGARTMTNYGSLQAFFPAVLALGGDLTRAERLQGSGFRMWRLHDIEPEEIDYRTMKVTSPGYQLRPEIVESAYYLYHYTHDPKYLRMGAEMFDDLVKYCRTDAGYTVLKNVVTKEQGDRMHSFLLAETFKYFYLLFAPDAIDFESVVFNTEAHPLRITP
ncbi:MAG TPA: glycoside hydrolase family 47 protein [Vicinamibacterales bacterium]|nr:glycoside hydrolase family 47 protein [Vicinamibacterales bacterium]